MVRAKPKRAAKLADLRAVLRSIAGKLHPNGTLTDQASVALERIRRGMERQRDLIQQSLEKFLHHRRGSPENPLKPEDIEYKFRHVVSGCLSKANIDKAVKLVAGLEKMENTNELTALMAAPVGV